MSIITVSYNSVKTIEQTIKSIISQTYSNIQYIIIDGGSTDGTVDIIKKYENNIAYWISEPDKGIYDAMNKGISKCEGDIIGIINSDDWYEADALEKVIKIFKENPKADLVCGSQNTIRNIDKNIYCFTVQSKINVNLLKKNMCIYHPTVFVKKCFYFKFGNFDTTFTVAADWDLILRAAMAGGIYISIPDVLANFRACGISSQFRFQTLLEKYRIRAYTNQWNATYYLSKEIIVFCLFGIRQLLIPDYIYMKIKMKLWEKARLA